MSVAPISTEAGALSHAEASSDQAVVRAVDFDGNTLLSASQLQKAVAPYLGQPLRAQTLTEVNEAVMQAYDKAGYTGVLAYTPPQKAEDGALTVKIVEGHISKIDIQTTAYTDEANVRRSLPSLREGEPMRLAAVNAEIDLANENPRKHTTLTLKPGPTQGDILAEASVVDTRPWSGSVGLDNSGTGDSGKLRAKGSASYTNLFNRDQSLSMQFTVAPEHPALTNLIYGGYTAPIYSLGLLVGAYVAESHSAVGTLQTAAGPLNYSGDTTSYGFFVTRLLPRIGNYAQRLSVSLGGRQSRNECELAGSTEACGNTAVSFRSTPLSMTYSGSYASLDGKFAINGLVSLSHNIPTGGMGSQTQLDMVRPNAAASYDILVMQAAARLGRTNDAHVAANMTMQRASSPLVSPDAFHAGGMYSVRGYQEGELAGDNGVGGTVEVFTPAWSVFGGGVQLSGFVDAAHASNRDGALCDVRHMRSACTLVSTGAQVVWSSGRAWRVQGALARAMVSGPTTDVGSWHVLAAATYLF
ncbi:MULTISPECIES: ShlB/FhaC/HecB family hemolysin secretion/activation protein [unclassified Caballeronia]|uniref:ShlB/FhaC/HecB family hemolysin secretion/activation protein n=1 Tax=unclassified Caballeronia TaxID=2646786 RepID=UPI0020282430|nr:MULTISPECIES: ShlB/FhaC/HecB family hemolysin secretion/activation protein [unclassified Caballeronia]